MPNTHEIHATGPDETVLNWDFVWSLASVVDGDKEFTPVVIELPDHRRYVAHSYTERDSELVLLVKEETHA